MAEVKITQAHHPREGGDPARGECRIYKCASHGPDPRLRTDQTPAFTQGYRI